MDHLMEEIKRVTREKEEAMERLNCFKRLYAEHKKNPTINRSHFGDGKSSWPVFLCPLPYCVSHMININRHLKVAHPEIKTEKDIDLFKKLVDEMKLDISEKVGSLVPQSMTRNQALLQKLRLDLPKFTERQEADDFN